MKLLPLTLLAASAVFAQAPPPPPPPPPPPAAAASACAIVSPAAAKLEFDAASIKPAGPFAPGRGGMGFGGGPGSNDPGRASGNRVALATLIATAWDLWPDQVIGPDWMKDVINNGFALSATMPPTTTKEEYCGMLRNLVTSRFHLSFRIEKQSRPGYELTVLPGGPKFQKYDPNAPTPEPVAGRRVDANGFMILSPAQPTGAGMSMSSNGLRKMTMRNDIAVLARSLGSDINQSNGLGNDAPIPRVVDKTGLDGVYDIRLEFAGTPFSTGQPRDPDAPAPDPSDAPNIFNAVEKQLGLKLTKVKEVPVNVLIVDHADQTPTEN
ncbi:MAG TPA: TIGR03435 family protein [Bryobacteraceae bacterium]|jgi:uncharacterized protein (TIGR03435 family)